MAISGLGSGIGAKLSDGTDTYENVLSIGLLGGATGITDISSASSASQASEFLPGLVDAGYFTCVLRFGTTLGTVTEITADYGEVEDLKTTFLAREIDTWVLTIPGGAANGTWTCSGYIVKLGTAVHYKGGVQIQVIIRLTGVPAWLAATE